MNGVMRSGQISWAYAYYIRCGFRRGGKIANSASGSDIGFLCEWCIQGWTIGE